MEGFYIEPSPKITKEFIYNKVHQERIFEHYGVPIKKGLFTCPSHIRTDMKPTCSFYKNGKGELMFKDFAGYTFNSIGLVMHLFQCSYYKALRIVANDFGLIPSTKIEVNPPKIEYSNEILEETKSAKIQVELKEFSTKELNWWNEFGVTLEILKKYKVYSVKSIFLNDNYFTSCTDNSPIFGYYGGKDSKGDELWRLYFPKKLKYRFLSNWSSSMIQGIKQLPKSADNIIITKSMKDVMTLSGIDVPSISPNSENILITKNRFEKLKDLYSDVVCLFDNDLPGVKAVQKYKKEYNIRCVFIKRQYAKDISDLFKKLTYSNKLQAINELKDILKDKTITNTQYFYVFNG